MNELTPTRPYVGLIPFLEQDAEFFFGREQEQEIITSNLMASRLTLLYGASGVGKSSVLNAGVAHNLRLLAQRDVKRRGKPKFTVVVFSGWRDEPIGGLLTQVQQEITRTLAGQPLEPVPSGLSFVDSLREWSRRVEGQLLIILDQFEEYFLYHPDEDGAGTFAVEFPRAVNTPGLAANFIVSYREDAHAKLDFFKGRLPNLYDNYLRIGHLTYSAAYAAIKKPIARYNELRKLDDAHQYLIEEDLVTTILAQVKAGEKYIGESGKGVVEKTDDTANWEIETPYLQLVMTRLWDTEVGEGSRVLRTATLNKLGGAKRIVQTHLDDAMSQLTGKERSMGANIFNYLVTPSGTKIAQTAHDLAGYANLSQQKEDQLDHMLEKLAGGEQRILRTVPPPESQPNSKRYEVFHDVLAQAIIDWRKRFVARQTRLRYLKVIAVMAIILLFMGTATVYAWYQKNAARTAQNRAVSALDKESVTAAENQKLAISNKRLADRFEAAYKSEKIATSEAEKQRALALQAAKTAQAEQLEAEHEKARADVARLEAVTQTKLAQEQTKQAASSAMEAIKQKDIAEEQKQKAEAAAAEAKSQRNRAEDALNTVYEIDESNAYYKTVMRPRSFVSESYFSSDGNKVLTVSGDGMTHVWDAYSQQQPKEPLYVLSMNDADVARASFNPTATMVVSVDLLKPSLTSQVTMWDVTGTVARRLDSFSIKDRNGKPELLFGAVFDTDGNSVSAYGSQKAVVCKFDSATAKFEKDCRTIVDYESVQPTTIIDSVSPKGTFIVLKSPKETLLVDTATAVPTKLAPAAAVVSNIGTGVFVSPNEKFVITASPFNGANLFDAKSGGLLAQFVGPQATGPNAALSLAAFSPDSELVLTANADGTANVWDTRSHLQVATLRGHTAPITDAAFSPTDSYVVTASADKTARVWDLKSGNLFAELRGHIRAVDHVAFSPNGNFVLTSGDKTARVWDVSRKPSVPSLSAATGAIDNNGTFDLDNGWKNPVVVFGVSAADMSWRYTEDRGARSWLLNPENKAEFALFSDDKAPFGTQTQKGQRNFEDIGVTELLGLNYSGTAISGSLKSSDNPGVFVGSDTLSPGDIFAVRTSDGNYAKVEVVERANSLKIRWVTYKNPGPQQNAGPKRSQSRPPGALIPSAPSIAMPQGMPNDASNSAIELTRITTTVRQSSFRWLLETPFANIENHFRNSRN